MKDQPEIVECQICHLQKPVNEAIPAYLVRPAIAEIIKQSNPSWSDTGYICQNDLNHFRSKYVEEILKSEKGELTDLEKQVVDSLREQDVLSKNINTVFESKLSFGDQLADKVAAFGGSWGFIITFFVILILWIVLNSLILIKKPFDPYPFIFLNLILSCIAAIQAPVIMMSQNRQEAKDRIRSENDYSVNLKAELEIRHLNEKIDHLLIHQWQRLLEIQQIQIDEMEDLIVNLTKPENKTS